jgi:chorismate mutase
VAAWKFTTGGVVVDPRREQEVIDAVATYAVARSVDPDFVKDVFRDQIDATRTLEHGRIAQWRLNPASVPADVPELSSCRADIDVLNRTMVDEIALRWDSLRSPASAPDLEKAKRAVIAARRLDAPSQQALAYATQKYCR